MIRITCYSNPFFEGIFVKRRMKKRTKILLKFFFIYNYCFIKKIFEDKRKNEICEKKDYLIFKQERVLTTYEKWIRLYQNKRLLSDYLLENNYYEIAIYGLGRLGKQLYEELLVCGVSVAYVIDQNYGKENKSYKGTFCYRPEDKLPKVDLIIVTIPSEEKDIIAMLRKKVTYPIKSINDILFVS